HGDSQPGAGAAPGRRGDLSAGRSRHGARADRAVFRPPGDRGGSRVHERRIALGVALATALAGFITVASTTSTEQSGLFKHLLPIFEKKTGIQVRVVAVGTGQALDIGRRGDADVVLVHAKPLEEKFMAEGQGVKRHDVMYNDFVLIGPKCDPAKVAGGKDVVAALPAIQP